MTAHVPKDRADIQASSAADAMQAIPLLGISQQLRAMIVQ